MRASWRTVLALAALIGLWELYVDTGGADPLILPSPHAVASSLYDDRGLLWSNFVVTAGEVLLGILLAAVAALLAAVAMHFFLTLRRTLYPLLIASQTVPVPLLAPVLVLWLGFGLLPKLIVVALVSFFSIVVTTLAGLASIDPDLIKLMRTFDASRWRTFRHVELPAALPGVFTGSQDRRHRGRDRRRVRRAVRRQLRARISVRAVDPPAAHCARLRGRRHPLAVRHRPLRRC